jgi:PPOX class probable F420-dependent enzyme
MTAEVTPEIDAFLRETRVGVIATVDGRGHPRTTPIWFLWDDGAAYLFTGRKTRKWRNLLANPRVSLCVDHRQPPYASVILDGAVEEVTASMGRSLYEDVRRMAVAYYGPVEGEAFAGRYRGDQPDVAHFRLVPERITHQQS